MVTGDRTGIDVDNEEGSVRSVGNSKLCVTPTKMPLTRLGEVFKTAVGGYVEYINCTLCRPLLVKYW